MEQQKPRDGDTIRVTPNPFEGVVTVAGGNMCTVHTSGGPRMVRYDQAVIEVLERADDPSRNKIGTVRRENYDDGHSAWQCVEDPSGVGCTRWLCVHSTDPNVVGEFVEHASVLDLPVIGAAPGTPAAEVEKPERQVPLELRQKLADVLVAGDKDRAVRIALNWGMEYSDAVGYVGAMPEYQTGLNHRPIEDVPLPNLGARVFPSDGPEPPAGVDNLEVLDLVGALNHKRYLRRGCVGWHFTNDLTADVSNVIGFNWPASVAGTFREVV